MTKSFNNSRKKNSRKKKNNQSNIDVVKCCMCEKKYPIDTTLVPRVCLEENREFAHRICQKCWWNPVKGFAIEGATHSCPGCKKNIPLLRT